ncbi:MAG TPA: hypothetical protein VKM55_04195 [Candidatus Lokiarchaeia archaeon]|nr:hypothetical protein [Candidatus Lokiarchaeia archaeon]
MLLELKEEYERQLPKNQAGIQFNFAHVVLALFLFDMYGKMGRVDMAQQLTMGRGSLRTFARRLKTGLGLIESSSTRAHVLSPKGRDVLAKIKEEFALIGNIPVVFDELTFAAFNAIGRLSSSSIELENIDKIEPLRLVNVARAQGGKGLISLIVQPDRALKLIAVPVDLKKSYTSEWIKLNELFSLYDGDLLLIASADTELEAKLAVIAATIDAVQVIGKHGSASV